MSITVRQAVALGYLLLFPCLCIAQPTPPTKLTVESVREILLSDLDEVWRDRGKLVALGSTVFPVYEAILADPKSGAHEYERIFSVLRDVPADRSRFVEPAIRSLTHSHESLRYSAVRLLARIGSEKDTAPVIALLFDEESLIVHEAAETIALIGGQRDLIALDAWLRAAAAKKLSSIYIEGVRKPREALKKRLDREENTKAPAPRLVVPCRP